MYIPCTYIYRNVHTCMYMFMFFNICIYHVCQPLYTSIVYTLYIHGSDMSVHVYARWSGFQIISKPSFPYDTIMTFWINYTHYDTIITLLLHLWHLQKSDYYDTLWQKPGKGHYYTYDKTIITIMTYYDTYVHYNTIISIITFWTIITLMTLRYYYCILWQ